MGRLMIRPLGVKTKTLPPRRSRVTASTNSRELENSCCHSWMFLSQETRLLSSSGSVRPSL